MRKTGVFLRVTHLRRTSTVRVHSAIGRNATIVLSPEFTGKRTYYPQEGYPPPNPPPGYYGQGHQGYPAPPQGYPPQGYPPPGYASNGYNAPPGQQYSQQDRRGRESPIVIVPPSVPSDLGTQERPIVITSAPQKASWTTRLWMLLLIGIGLSCLLSLIDELSDRFQPRGSAGGRVPGGGRSPFGMFGSSDVQPVNLDDLDVTFDTIRGCDEAKKELEEIVEFLKDPEKFHELGGRLPKGALLVGPPGCGKTLLAKGIAKEAGVQFFYATGSEFDEMFVGVGARRVRELFAAAKANAPALIFIDEIDALGGRRSKSDQSHSRMTLNQLLAEMDGFKSNESIIVLAATNTPDTLDSALTRPGRLDTTIAVDPPDMKGRAEVAQVYLDKIRTDGKITAMDIAKGTTGFTGAELSNLINIAAIRAAVMNKASVTIDEIEYAKDRVMMGAESKKIIPEEERRVTAYHEGGHALAAILLKDQGSEPVHKATIVPRGNGIMGLVQQLPEKDKYSQSKKQCLARLKVCVAGRVGEEILLGDQDITTGAGSDFQQATRMARNMVRRFGFSDDLGVVDYESPDSPEGAYMSDKTKEKIEGEVEKLLRDAYTETKRMLIDHRKDLDSIAQNLIQYETLTGEEINKLLRGEAIPPRPPRVEPQPSPSKTKTTSTKQGRREVPIA